MVTPEESTVVQMSDLLIELHVRRDEARRDAKWRTASTLQDQIHEVAAAREELLAGARGRIKP